MLTLTSETRTWSHGVPAGAKFASLFAATALLLMLDGLVAQLAMLTGTGLLYLSAGWRFTREGARALRLVVVIALLVALWNAALGTPERGAVVALRLVTAVALANAVTMTTRLDETLGLVERLLSRLGVPAVYGRRFALAVALTIRFIPVLAAKAALLADAWRVRSPRRPSARIVLPMALVALDDAEHVADALRARGGA
jgi:biotin transport system permease protein